jgi:hypothetical protein
MLEIRRRARRIIMERFDLRSVCLPRQVKLVEGLGYGQFPNVALQI